MARTLIIRKPVASLESEAMSDDLYAEQVAEHAVESARLDQSVDADIEESETTVASLESRIEQLNLLATFANTPIHSFEQASLTMAVAYSAVQGTDLDVHADVLGKSASQVSHSFENSEGLTYSPEAIGQTIKDMGKAALEKLKQAGKWLYELVVKIINLFKSKEGRIKNLKAMIDEGKKESKAKADDTVRLTGSQVANVGTVSQYAELVKVFKQLNGENPKYIALMNAIEKETARAFKMDGFEKGSFDRDAMNRIAIASNDALNSYITIFKLRFTDGPDGKSQAVSPLIGKRKVKVVKSDVKPINGADGSTVISMSDHVSSMKFSLAKDENTPESVMAPVLTIQELETVVRELETAIAGKVIDLATFKLLANHQMFNGEIFKNHGLAESGRAGGASLNYLARMVRDVVIAPHGLLATTFQSVTDDYLRYAERSAKFHVKGKTAVAETADSGAPEEKVENNIPAVA